VICCNRGDAMQGMGATVFAESAVESGIPGIDEVQQITPTGERGPIFPVDTAYSAPIGHPGPLEPMPTEYVQNIGPRGGTGPLIPLGSVRVSGLNWGHPLVKLGAVAAGLALAYYAYRKWV
jgi:hypothetical protein